jgi:aldose 1-epimerase
MSWIVLSLVAYLTSQTLAAKGSGWQAPPPEKTEPIPVGSDGKYTIVAEGIRAQFIPYGASLTNLFINDTNGVERDVVLGYDNATYYTQDASHPHLGGVPGM